MKKNTPEVFWSRVDKNGPNGCWLWKGQRNMNRGGYGIIRWDGATWRANRLAWVLMRGPIPENMFVCHHCDNPQCVNPDHLFVATHRENVDDMVRKQRSLHGAKNPAARLTAEQVSAIRKEYAELPGPRLLILAKKYGASKSLISLIVRREIWRSV